MARPGTISAQWAGQTASLVAISIDGGSPHSCIQEHVNKMTDMTPGYYDLRVNNTWMDHLRTRLPYSCNRIEAKGSSQSRHLVLSEPALLTSLSAAERHNFRRLGNVYYMSGMLLDYYSMSEFDRGYRMAEVKRLLTDPGIASRIWPRNAVALYNSMQMEKVRGFAQANHLDRERVMMTNVVLAMELCLKAVSTHATFRQTGTFRFNAGHDGAKLYDALPDSLRDEIAAESEVFATEYVAFRANVEAGIRRIFDRSQVPSHVDLNRKEHAETEWNELAKRIRESAYTAFVTSNDRGADSKYMHQGWFREAPSQVRLMEGTGGICRNFRYAPHED